MLWAQRGKLAVPGSTWWASSHLGASHGLVLQGRSLVITSGRGSDNRSRLGLAQFTVPGPDSGKFSLSFASDPILSPNESKFFWADGLTYPSILGSDLMPPSELLFTGWKRGPGRTFSNHLGIARPSEDGSMWLVDPKPLFPDWEHGTGSAAPLHPSGEVLAVTAFTKPEVDSEGFLPKYSVRWAERSANGKYVMGEIISGIPTGPDISVARPSFLSLRGKQFAWFSVRKGRHYSVVGGVVRQGKFMAIGSLSLFPTGESWESNSVSYLHCWLDAENVWGVYSGNGYGKDGLGYVSAPMSALLAVL